MRLTDQQRAQLTQAASLLPIESRDQFLQAAMHRFDGIHHPPTSDDVAGAIITALPEMRHSIERSSASVPLQHDLFLGGLHHQYCRA
jgi:hypothetical protein